ncbi:MAG TPA: hypothetical protein VIU14_03565 [Mesorhizobium sp.]|jgi:hypothetical protein
MNIVDLILTVCMAANGNACHDEHLYFESHGSLMQCMFLAPAEMAKWSETHPKLKIIRWKCAYPDKGQDI